MAWFSNRYECERCGRRWTDEWSCMCEDDCPYCEARHMSPICSDDLTKIIESRDGHFIVLWSSEDADDHPDYREVGVFSSREQAEAYLPRV